MNVKKRAIESVMIAALLVMMSAVAAAVTVDDNTAAAEETKTDLAANTRAGVIIPLGMVQAAMLDNRDAAADIRYTETTIVSAAEAELSAVSAEEEPILEEESILEETESSAAPAEEEPILEEAVLAEEEFVLEAAELAAAEESAEPSEEIISEEAQIIVSEEELEWQNRLMADVQEFLYVRAAGDENAEIVGKLYKGAAAEIVEYGDTWTHIVSGNVDGYVLNSYCLFGTDAMNYAAATFDTEAEIQTDGLRVRREAHTEGSVIAAVSTGTSLTVDTEAEIVDGWVAVDYEGETGYVSAEYVTTELALGEAITLAEEQEELARIEAQKAAAAAAQVSSFGKVQGRAIAASTDDVTLLAALIQCEAGNESYEGQLAVGAVVMNRVKSGRYPNSISGVIYQAGQFPPAANGAVAAKISNGVKESCRQAAREALNGMDNTSGALYFCRTSSGHAGVVIGNHVFY